MVRVALALVIMGSVVLIQSCGESVRTELTTAERKLVDSLYTMRVSAVRTKTDSICKAQYKSVFDAAADSFYQEYVREIERILNGEG